MLPSQWINVHFHSGDEFIPDHFTLSPAAESRYWLAALPPRCASICALSRETSARLLSCSAAAALLSSRRRLSSARNLAKLLGGVPPPSMALAGLIAISGLAPTTPFFVVVGQWGGAGGAVCEEDHFALAQAL